MFSKDFVFPRFGIGGFTVYRRLNRFLKFDWRGFGIRGTLGVRCVRDDWGVRDGLLASVSITHYMAIFC